ncbi:MAG TPA: peptidylprolyl isomerase [Candidatus Acidoferrum sp.]|nr:peptidylprolyl isomerase [Candidatus Acidoferrum sp.]
MRDVFSVLVLLVAGVISALGQSSTQAAPAAKTPVHHAPTHTATGQPTAIIETTVGKMTCILFPDKAPIGVENFIGLATGKKDWTNPASGAKKHGVPLYDGTIFHRVIPGFMIQGGDPKGDGTGDPGYKFKNEVSSELRFDRPGRLAYANSGPDTNGSQFFITEDVAHSQHLSGSYTIFGLCDDASVTLVKQIASMATDPRNDRPFRPVKIIHIKIERAGSATPPVKSATPARKPAATTPKPPSN